MPEPEITNPLAGELVDRVVAFIDVLGFTDVVKRACNGDSSSLAQVRNALQSIWTQQLWTRRGMMDMKQLTPEAQATAFSDNIVLSNLNRPSEIGYVFGMIASLAQTLLLAAR
jgi:hypothetical protein